MPKNMKPLANEWVYIIKDNPDENTKAEALSWLKDFFSGMGKIMTVQIFSHR
jgi:hypothetical protein